MTGIVELGVALAAGGLTTLSPCVLPLLPVMLGGALQGNRFAPAVMGAGMVTAFALFGVLAGLLGDAIGFDTDMIRLVGAWLLVALGVVMLVPALSDRFARWFSPLATAAGARAAQVDGGSLSGAFLLGALLGMVWSPCSGPLLASTLVLVASEGGALRGAMLLGMFGLGAALPLVALAYASRAGFTRARDKILAHVDTVKKVFGVVLLLLGLAILTGIDKRIEALLVQSLPEAWMNVTVLF